MGDNNMAALRIRVLPLLCAIALLAVMSQAALGAEATIKKSVTPMEDGSFMIKLNVGSTGSDIYGIRLIDPEAAIVNVFAPKGWCAVTDGEDYLAKTLDTPVKSGNPTEFIIHSTSDKVNYSWTVYGKMKQLGNPETL
jgi:hypothetical protein